MSYVRDEHGRFTKVTAVSPVAKPTLLQLLKDTLNLSTWPTWSATVLALACGALTVLNQTTLPQAIGYHGVVQTAITWALAGFAFMGIGPIMGARFAAAIKLPAQIAGGISLLLLVGLTVAQEDVSLPYRAIIIGIVQVAGGLGFEPAYLPTVNVRTKA